MKVSVITTVKNERDTIHSLLQSLLAQTRPADEIVIVDGGSTDGTADIVREFVRQGAPIKLIVSAGSNIAQGRNIAIRAAEGDIIVSTDAGVRLARNWLENLLAGFEASAGGEDVDVVAGFFVPDPQTAFETSMGATVLPAVRDVKPQNFLPSSRSIAFSKKAWAAVGGYPEWLDYCEDVVFDLMLRDAGFRFAFAPDAVAYFRPRRDLLEFFKQYYMYARGDGKANLWPRRHLIRYLTYTGAPIALVAGFWYKLIWLLVAFAAGLYLWGPYRRLWHCSKLHHPGDRLRALLWVPVIRLTGDVAKMIGYPAGVWWRLRNRG
ncbi:MAG: glycosyltransferase [Chloroflexi bacterium]|nr:glycosyltransferase [Chloroflexota bacterium]